MAKTSKTLPSPPVFQIKRIKEVAFLLNEQFQIPDPNKIVRLELYPRLGFNPESNLVALELRAYYHYPERSAEEILMEIRVETRFEVPDLKQYISSENLLVLPPELITEFVQLSMSHTRALFAQNLAGSVYQDIIMPIHDPKPIAQFFFAYMFKPTRSASQKGSAQKSKSNAKPLR